MAQILRNERKRLGAEAYDLALHGCTDNEIATYSGHTI